MTVPVSTGDEKRLLPVSHSRHARSESALLSVILTHGKRCITVYVTASDKM